MASANVKKWQRRNLRSGGTRAHFVDNLRKKCEHSNKDLNRELTPLNYWMGSTGYDDVLQKMDDRVATVDAVQPPERFKSDRITGLSINVPCPEKITQDGRSREFMSKSYKVMESCFGKDNVMGMTVHYDEVHDYYDQDKGCMQTSLVHGHVFAVPFTDDKGINCKALCTRQFLRNLNKAMDDMCRREFGIAYQTGEYARNKSIEQLKAESYRELQRAEGEKTKQIQEASERILSLNETLKGKMTTVNELEAKIASQRFKKDAITVWIKTQLPQIRDMINQARQQMEDVGVLDMSYKYLEFLKEHNRTTYDEVMLRGIEGVDDTFREIVKNINELTEDWDDILDNP